MTAMSNNELLVLLRCRGLKWASRFKKEKKEDNTESK